MAKRIRIYGNSLIVEDTVSGITELNEPSKDVYFDNTKLNNGTIVITQKDGARAADLAIFETLLSNAIDKDDVSFTESTFRKFTSLHLSGNKDHDFIADETNTVAIFLLNGASFDQAINGSVTPVEFSYSPPTGFDFICARIVFYMEGTGAFDSNLFGDQTALTNGWTIEMNGVEAMVAKTNRDLGTYMYDMKGDEIYGKVNRTIIGRFSFNKFTDGADGITIRDGESFKTIVKDNLSGLTYLEAKIMGVLKPV